MPNILCVKCKKRKKASQFAQGRRQCKRCRYLYHQNRRESKLRSESAKPEPNSGLESLIAAAATFSIPKTSVPPTPEIQNIYLLLCRLIDQNRMLAHDMTIVWSELQTEKLVSQQLAAELKAIKGS